MPTLSSHDGTLLSYRLLGQGPPLVCVAGGPARDSAYFGNLGGLDAERTLVLLDNRGSGLSGDAADPSDVDSYRADHLVLDVEALRAHLGLEAMDLLGHSAGAQVAVLYAAAHPRRLSSLALICGGHSMVGAVIEDAFMRAIESKAGEPWYTEARQAFDEWGRRGADVTPDVKLAASPFFYGRPWTPEKHAHAAADASQRRNPLARKHFPFDPDPAAVRAALSHVTAPVLAYAGGVDPSPRPEEAQRLAAVFPNGRTIVQPDAGHFPWLDNPTFFVEALLEHLA
jgi:pimeloyl-ACP methyl ester carboxylesterase